MLKIGDFSRLGQVSVRTLRYYDEIGLLRPDRTDRSTGYRYYSPGQLSRLNRILILRDLGFSLGQIGRRLEEELPAASLRAMLAEKRSEAERRLRERMARLEARIRQIEREDKPCQDDTPPTQDREA